MIEELEKLAMPVNIWLQSYENKEIETGNGGKKEASGEGLTLLSIALTTASCSLARCPSPYMNRKKVAWFIWD